MRHLWSLPAIGVPVPSLALVPGLFTLSHHLQACRREVVVLDDKVFVEMENLERTVLGNRTDEQ